MEWWPWFREELSIYEMAEEGKTSLYVSDLEPSVTDSELFDAFIHASRVESVRVCRDLTRTRSLGYGYAIFDCPHDAKRAQEMLNFTALKGKDIRVMYYVHNPRLRKRGVGNVFIKNLEKSIDHRALYETLCCFGTILRFKVATDAFGESKGFGFGQYNTEESAQKAIKYLNGMLLNDEQVYVGPFLQRDSLSEKVMFTDIYVKNLSKSLTDEELNTIFREFGPTTSCVIIRDGEVLQGKSKGYGFVNFENPEDAEKAVKALNGKKFEDKGWFVTKSKKKYQMESQVKRGLKQSIHRSQGLNNLCVKKLDKRVTDEILSDFFSSYGTITSCKVMRDTSGESKGSGFVSFSKPEEALRAMEEINGELQIRKQVYVDLAIALADATPEHQRTMLGESLYPMVEQLAPKFAAKITGMILEMDQTQVLHLLESFDALESKVTEAIEIMKTVNKQQQQLVGSVTHSDLEKVTKSADNSKASLSPKALDRKPNSSARGRERSAVAMEVVRTVKQQQQQTGDASESPVEHSGSDHKATKSTNNSKRSSSPSFRSPKPRSLARVNNRISTRERSDVLLTNRFASLKDSGDDKDVHI